MATQSTSGKISDLYELKEELGKYVCFASVTRSVNLSPWVVSSLLDTTVPPICMLYINDQLSLAPS